MNDEKKNKKRETDLNKLAFNIVKESTEKSEDDKKDKDKYSK